MTPDLGVYIHFPYCRRRCPYCDFAIAIAPLADIPHERYADAVLDELRFRAPRFRDRGLVSVYFGGGTPALWRPAALARVLAGVVAELGPLAPDAEITVEANPNDCDPAHLAALREAGVNRLSVGAQGFDDEALVALGRDHDARQAAAGVAAARAAGFASVSLDLMYAVPGRRLAHWQSTLARAVLAAPDHLSVYQLTIEPGTPFGAAARERRLIPAPDEDCAAQFEEAHGFLTAAGYEHYEVSSYARPGRRARHNQGYWLGREYLGLGNGAHSFWRPGPDRGLRWSNHRSVTRYLQAAGEDRVAETGEQDARALAEDRLWLGVRTADGVPRAWVPAGAPLARLEAAGLVSLEGDRVRPTPRGLLFADEIGTCLLQ